MSGDNVRSVPNDRVPEAKAFMKLIEDIDAGTAFYKLPTDGQGHCVAPELYVGAPVRYRAMAGPVYDAKVTAVRGAHPGHGGFDWMVDIDVDMPGIRDPLHLTKIRCKVAK